MNHKLLHTDNKCTPLETKHNYLAEKRQSSFKSKEAPITYSNEFGSYNQFMTPGRMNLKLVHAICAHQLHCCSNATPLYFGCFYALREKQNMYLCFA